MFLLIQMYMPILNTVKSHFVIVDLTASAVDAALRREQRRNH
jgi:hypothetical protein